MPHGLHGLGINAMCLNLRPSLSVSLKARLSSE